jgi:hypothetical protein
VALSFPTGVGVFGLNRPILQQKHDRHIMEMMRSAPPSKEGIKIATREKLLVLLFMLFGLLAVVGALCI